MGVVDHEIVHEELPPGFSVANARRASDGMSVPPTALQT